MIDGRGTPDGVDDFPQYGISLCTLGYDEGQNGNVGV